MKARTTAADTERWHTREENESRPEKDGDLFDHAPISFLKLHTNGKIAEANLAAARLLQVERHLLLGKNIGSFLDKADQAGFKNFLNKVFASKTDHSCEVKLAIKDQTAALVQIKASLNQDGRQCLVVIIDVTHHKHAEQYQLNHNRALQMLLAKAPLANILDTIAKDVETINPEMMCSILLLDEDGKHLRHGAAPSLPDFYNRAVDGLEIGLGVGSCGTAAYTRELVIVEDIETHPWWASFIDFPRQAGLRACWSHPILSGHGKVLGTFAIYHRNICHPSAQDLQLIADEAHLAALAIEKTSDEAKLQLAASVFTHAREGIMITDATSRIVEVNDTFTQITGYSREEIIDQSPRILRSDRHSPDFYESIWQSLDQDGHWIGEMWNRRKNGEVYAEIQTISAVWDARGKTQNYVVMFTDITPMKKHQQQLEHIAHYDVLTGLPNRVMLANHLQQAIAHSQRNNLLLAVVYLDLDGFKPVNDNHGHSIGDQVLVSVAHRMKDTLRDGDILARIGGDEFVAILVDLVQSEDLELVLNRLLKTVAKPVNVANSAIQISTSIGVTIYPDDEADAEQLIRHADQAMYIAKQSGKNRYHVFDVDHDLAVKTQHQSIESIEKALKKQEFILYYQPKINLETGEIIGAEALIRWRHPKQGLLLPAAFLPIVENHPLSIEIGDWVIDTALNQMEQWQFEELDIPVSVNIGTYHLQHTDFFARLSKLMANHGDIQPRSLELEILETSALEDIAQASETIRACSEIGLRFSLDDFGTGYSSLTYLKHLPTDMLKIDRSFVQDMFDDANDHAIVEGLLGLAKAFHKDIIAEGVETAAHCKILLRLGCLLGQGYGIAAPMPADKMTAWVSSWRANKTWKTWSVRH